MSTTDEIADLDGSANELEAKLTLELGLQAAEALHTWLLKPAADGTTSLDDPLVNDVLSALARAIHSVQSVVNVRRELQQAGLDVSRLSDEQVRELGRRVSDAAMPGIRA